jgi:hypothetical protein
MHESLNMNREPELAETAEVLMAKVNAGRIMSIE